MKYQEIEGNLITTALEGKFNVIAHGCNCFCLQRAGIAKQMAEIFNTDDLMWEDEKFKGRINKLGMIDYQRIEISSGLIVDKKEPEEGTLTVVNAYTQYRPGKNLDCEALILCLRKMNHEFKGKHIGLPQIGCGIAGGDWDIVKEIIKKELKNCDVTIVVYKNS